LSGGALVRAQHLAQVERLTLRERIGRFSAVGQHRVDRGVDLLIGNLGDLRNSETVGVAAIVEREIGGLWRTTGDLKLRTDADAS
jgi:hypothetical protein